MICNLIGPNLKVLSFECKDKMRRTVETEKLRLK